MWDSLNPTCFKELSSMYEYIHIFWQHKIEISSDILRNLFDKVLCGSWERLIISFTHKFIIDLAVIQFIYHWLGITHTIDDHQACGAFADIVLFHPGIIQTFWWTHPAARPMIFPYLVNFYLHIQNQISLISVSTTHLESFGADLSENKLFQCISILLTGMSTVNNVSTNLLAMFCTFF